MHVQQLDHMMMILQTASVNNHIVCSRLAAVLDARKGVEPTSANHS
jgi:hypothetical protein